MAKQKLEQKYIAAVKAVEAHAGNQAEAAASLGLARSTLQCRLAIAARSDLIPHIESVDTYVEAERAKIIKTDNTQITKALGKKVVQLEQSLADALQIKKNLSTYAIKANPLAKSEATAVWLASDWHMEENVTLAQTNGINEYNLEIAKSRGEQYFVNALRLTNKEAQDISITQIVIGLLGDFITNHLHAQNVETNNLPPVEAAIFAMNIIASGIQYVLAHSKYKLLLVCASGNHARTTKFSEFGSENGHSHEYFMYCSLRQMFKDEPRVQFIISEGAHTYVDIYNFPIRFLHGHDMRYIGGVGGITIPVNKAIAQWDKARPAYLTCFGHFHQRLDGGNFVANGSLIGYNSFALSIKASAEAPAQQFFLLDKVRGKTVVAPILVN